MINLIKTKKLIEKCMNLFERHSLSSEDIKSLEKKLDITFPEDFILLTKYFNGYDPIGYMSLFSFDPKEVGWNILEETLKIREAIQMPKNYVVLANENESFIAMLTKEDRLEETPVYWIGYSDVYNLAEGKPLQDNPTIFPSFTDFFEYLVESEENKREEERKESL